MSTLKTNVATERKAFPVQSSGGVVVAFTAVACSLSLLLSWPYPSVAMTSESEPQCGFFPVGAKCTPEYRDLLKKYKEVDQEGRAHRECVSELSKLVGDSASTVKMLDKGCPPAYQNVLEAYKSRGVAYDELVRHTNSFPDLRNPHTLTRRDGYTMGIVGGAVVVFFFVGVLASRTCFVKPQDSKFEAPKGRGFLSKREHNSANQEDKITDDFIESRVRKEFEKVISEVKEASALAMKVANQADEKADRAIEVSSRTTAASIAGRNSVHMIGGSD